MEINGMEIIGVIMSLFGSLLVKETRSLLLKFLHYFWLSDTTGYLRKKVYRTSIIGSMQPEARGPLYPPPSYLQRGRSSQNAPPRNVACGNPPSFINQL